ncbi:hypothetical protein HDU99_008099 [Rhizoclosmatium hyalinum]|nr:hypothetical protein HDU99_008099 [Rhizoclosmatium hyalinum]
MLHGLELSAEPDTDDAQLIPLTLLFLLRYVEACAPPPLLPLVPLLGPPKRAPTSISIKLLFVVALALARKWHCCWDHTHLWEFAAYCYDVQVYGVSTAALVRYERKFLQKVDYKVHVTAMELDAWKERLFGPVLEEYTEFHEKYQRQMLGQTLRQTLVAKKRNSVVALLSTPGRKEPPMAKRRTSYSTTLFGLSLKSVHSRIEELASELEKLHAILALRDASILQLSEQLSDSEQTAAQLRLALDRSEAENQRLRTQLDMFDSAESENNEDSLDAHQTYQLSPSKTTSLPLQTQENHLENINANLIQLESCSVHSNGFVEGDALKGGEVLDESEPVTEQESNHATKETEDCSKVEGTMFSGKDTSNVGDYTHWHTTEASQADADDFLPDYEDCQESDFSSLLDSPLSDLNDDFLSSDDEAVSSNKGTIIVECYPADSQKDKSSTNGCSWTEIIKQEYGLVWPEYCTLQKQMIRFRDEHNIAHVPNRALEIPNSLQTEFKVFIDPFIKDYLASRTRKRTSRENMTEDDNGKEQKNGNRKGKRKRRRRGEMVVEKNIKPDTNTQEEKQHGDIEALDSLARNYEAIIVKMMPSFPNLMPSEQGAIISGVLLYVEQLRQGKLEEGWMNEFMQWLYEELSRCFPDALLHQAL